MHTEASIIGVLAYVLSSLACTSPAPAPCIGSAWQTITSKDGKHQVNVWKIAESKTALFVAGMSIDADGSPHAYHPNNIGLDDNANAQDSNGKWVGVVTANGSPVIQGPNDPAPGYYVSPTTLADTSKTTTDPHRYVDSEVIPFIALPPNVLTDAGAKMGDFVAVMNLKNDALAFALVADRGASTHIGEGSIALAKALGINSNARTGGVDKDVAYLLFLGSGNGHPRSSPEIESEGQQLLKGFGGTSRLSSCVTALH